MEHTWLEMWHRLKQSSRDLVGFCSGQTQQHDTLARDNILTENEFGEVEI